MAVEHDEPSDRALEYSLRNSREWNRGRGDRRGGSGLPVALLATRPRWVDVFPWAL